MQQLHDVPLHEQKVEFNAKFEVILVSFLVQLQVYPLVAFLQVQFSLVELTAHIGRI